MECLTCESKCKNPEDVILVRKIAEEIYHTLGSGHTESVYHNAMKIGLQDANFKYETERDIILRFRERYIGTVRADLIVEQRLVIELKATTGTDAAMSDAEEQCRLYMNELGIEHGLVILFPKRANGKLMIHSVSMET